MLCRIVPSSKFAVKPSNRSSARFESDGTGAETRFGLSAKRTSPFKLAGGRGGGGQFSRLLAAEVCASAVVMVVMLDTPCSEVECKTTGYPLHSHISRSLPLPCFSVCHQVSTELYLCEKLWVLSSTLSFIHMVHQHLPTTLPRLHEREDEGTTIPSKLR